MGVISFVSDYLLLSILISFPIDRDQLQWRDDFGTLNYNSSVSDQV